MFKKTHFFRFKTNTLKIYFVIKETTRFGAYTATSVQAEISASENLGQQEKKLKHSDLHPSDYSLPPHLAYLMDAIPLSHYTIQQTCRRARYKLFKLRSSVTPHYLSRVL